MLPLTKKESPQVVVGEATLEAKGRYTTVIKNVSVLSSHLVLLLRMIRALTLFYTLVVYLSQISPHNQQFFKVFLKVFNWY